MRSVICFQELKAAALYFDRVLPLAFRRMAGTGIDIVTEFPEPVPSRALIHIVLDKAAAAGSERYTDFGRIIDGWGEFRTDSHAYMAPIRESSSPTDYRFLEEAYLRDAKVPGSPPLRRLVADYASSLGFTGPSVLLPSTPVATSPTEEDPIVRLCHVSLIDTDRASWEQIVEIRSDAQARKHLQRLRAFAESNYAGKSLSFIEDDLSARLDEYESASRKHGFEMVTGSLSTLLDSSNLHAAVGTTLAAAILGGPIVALSAAATIELGKFSLEFAKHRRAMLEWRNAHPLAYIVETVALANEA